MAEMLQAPVAPNHLRMPIVAPTFVFNCGACRARLSATPAHIGAKMPCPKCGQRLQIPAPPRKPVPPPNRTVLGDFDGSMALRGGVVPPAPAAPAGKKAAKRPWVLAVSGVAAAALLLGLGFFVWKLAAPAPAPVPVPAPVVVHVDPPKPPEPPKPQPPAELKPQEVAAKAMPSVALIKNRGGSGSGFLVEGGFVVTNSHVAATDMINGLTVTFPSSEFKAETYKARLAYEDRTRDIAVLQIQNAPALPPLRLRTTPPEEGEDVMAIGSPGVPGIAGGVSENSTDKGTLGNPNFHTTEGNLEKKNLHYIQHSAKINHGNSGGPLLDMHAEVIGVNVIGIEGLDGIKLAIPADELRVILTSAAGRDAAAMDRATTNHDALFAYSNLTIVTATYIVGDDKCLKAASDAVKNGKKPGDAFKQVQDTLIDQQNQIIEAANQGHGGVRWVEPETAELNLLEKQNQDIAALLAGSSLPADMRDKLTHLRELYLDLKSIYEKPQGTPDNLKGRLDKDAKEFLELQKEFDGKFAWVF